MGMTQYHAVLIDETGCEFGAGVEAPDRETARASLTEDYPESRVVQLESPLDAAEREAAIRRRVEAEFDHGDELDEDDFCYDCEAPVMDDGFCPNGCDH